MASTSAPEISSTAPSTPNPALLISTSIRPNHSTVWHIASRACSSFVTSSLIARRLGRAPNFSARTWGLRAAATTLSPRPNASLTNRAPNPRDAPVINQVFIRYSFEFNVDDFLFKATRSQALHPLSLEVVRASYFFVMEWISAMYPPGNLTTTASRSSVLYGGTRTSAPAVLALASVSARFLTSYPVTSQP